jgi:lipopolysaccharide export system protein LptA
MEKDRIDNVLSKIILGLLLLAGFSSFAFALESDADQPIYIDSNSATYDDKKGVSIYTGKVVASQGSMVLYSDKLVVYLKDGIVDKLVGTGVPARFKQTPEGGKQDIKGKSLTLEYYPEQALLVLIKEAVVTQGTNTYASDLIKYNNITSIVMAGEKSSDTKRVRVILQPKKKNSGNNGQARSDTADKKIQ